MCFSVVFSKAEPETKIWVQVVSLGGDPQERSEGVAREGKGKKKSQ